MARAVKATGFSQNIFLPAATAAVMRGMWLSEEVAMRTALTLSSARAAAASG